MDLIKRKRKEEETNKKHDKKTQKETTCHSEGKELVEKSKNIKLKDISIQNKENTSVQF